MLVQLMSIEATLMVIRKINLMMFPLFLLTFGFSNISYSFSFVPTESEFYTWDNRCRALYVSTTIGSFSRFKGLVPAYEVKKWRDASVKQGGPWHYCEGLIHLQRAKVAINDEKREKHFTAAYKAIKYTYVRISESDPWSAEMGIKMAEAADGLGKTGEANRYLENVVTQFPQYASAYTGKSYFLWKKGKLQKAIETLEEAKENLNHPTSEIYYFLGLYYVDNDNLAKAKENAEKAYEMGYPLTGLKSKIEQLENK